MSSEFGDEISSVINDLDSIVTRISNIDSVSFIYCESHRSLEFSCPLSGAAQRLNIVDTDYSGRLAFTVRQQNSNGLCNFTLRKRATQTEDKEKKTDIALNSMLRGLLFSRVAP